MISISCLLFFYPKPINRNYFKEYWVWAGILPENIPPSNTLYVYQGVSIQKEGEKYFVKKGLFPHPINAKALYLVFRIEGGLPEPANLTNIILIYIAEWQKYGTNIVGIQLDFDSPTAQLLKYNEFLVVFRKLLPLNFKISITGLGDWVRSGNTQILSAMTKSIDEIVFQLYQVRKLLPDINLYIEELTKMRFPFKIGLLANQPLQVNIVKLLNNPYYLGEIIFLQK